MRHRFQISGVFAWSMMREQIPHTEGGGGIHSRAYNQRDRIPAPWHASEIRQNIPLFNYCHDGHILLAPPVQWDAETRKRGLLKPSPSLKNSPCQWNPPSRCLRHGALCGETLKKGMLAGHACGLASEICTLTACNLKLQAWGWDSSAPGVFTSLCSSSRNP